MSKFIRSICLIVTFIAAFAARGSAGDETAATGDPFHIDWDTFCATHAAKCDRDGNPHYVPADANMIANTFPLSLYDAGITHFCAGKYAVPGNGNCGFVVGIYQAKLSDPLVTIHLTMYKSGSNVNDNGPLDGSQVRIPRNALPQPVGDAHLNVRQPNGVMCEFWQVNYTGASPAPTPGPVNGSILNAAAGKCGGTDGGAYAAHVEVSHGLIRAEDLAGSNGDGTDRDNPYSYSHAVYGSIPNNRGGTTWPALASDGQCDTKSHGGARPVEGMYMYLDTAGYEIVKRWSPPVYLRPLQRFLGNMHKHGMIDLDSAGCGDEHHYIDTLTWGPQEVYQKTGTSIFDTYLAKYIAPYDSQYIGQGTGKDQAIYKKGPLQYEFHMLQYMDVPGLQRSNFHWINLGCAQLAAQGASDRPC